MLQLHDQQPKLVNSLFLSIFAVLINGSLPWAGWVIGINMTSVSAPGEIYWPGESYDTATYQGTQVWWRDPVWRDGA